MHVAQSPEWLLSFFGFLIFVKDVGGLACCSWTTVAIGTSLLSRKNIKIFVKLGQK